MLKDFLENVRFFQPSLPLTQRLFTAVDAARSEDLRRIQDDDEQVEQEEDDLLELSNSQKAEGSPLGLQTTQVIIDTPQRLVAENLYYHLAFLAGNPKAKRGEGFSKDSIVLGMSNYLGLSSQDPLLRELADEFGDWLSERGEFSAAWGRIILSDNDRFYLEEFEDIEAVADKPPKRIFIPHSSTEQIVTLRLGDLAPDFMAETTAGPIRFHDWIEGSWVCLFSYPKDFAPVSTTEIGEVSRLKTEFEKRNVKVIGLSVDEADSHKRWANDIAETQGTALNFPVIADPDHQVAALYGLIHPHISDIFTVNSVFVIGLDKKIKLMITYPASTGRNFDEILRVIDSLQLTAAYSVVTPVNWKDGDDVIIVPALSDQLARDRFPGGWRAIKPYLRVVRQPNKEEDKAAAH